MGCLVAVVFVSGATLASQAGPGFVNREHIMFMQPGENGSSTYIRFRDGSYGWVKETSAFIAGQRCQ